MSPLPLHIAENPLRENTRRGTTVRTEALLTPRASLPLVVEEEEETTPSQAAVEYEKLQRKLPAKLLLWTSRSCYPWLLLHLSLMLCYSIVFFLSIRHCILCPKRIDPNVGQREQDYIYSPMWPVVEYETKVFEGGLWHESPFKGTPRHELEMAWKNITTDYIFGVPQSALGKLSKPELSVKFPESGGKESGQYMAATELFHQMHCLNLVRKYTYKSYYETTDISFSDPPELLRTHVDHCIDIIRQNLLCKGDVGLVTYLWVEGRQMPLPDFSTKHRCRKFEPLQNWVLQNKVQIGEFAKPEEAMAVPTPD